MPKNNLLPAGTFFTTIPDYFLTHIMADLSASELRVMLYIYLHTLGYGKTSDAISYDQFINGIVTHDGRRVDSGAGVSRRSLVSALVALENRKLITRRHNAYAATSIQVELEVFSSQSQLPEVKAQEQVQEISLAATSLTIPPLLIGADNDETSIALPEGHRPGKPYKAAKPVEIDTIQQVEKRQSLPSLSGAEVQSLPSNLSKEMQNLLPTKEVFGFKHEDLNRGNLSETAELSVVKFIRDNISAISSSEALTLTKIAFNEHGRDQAYLCRLVKYIQVTPSIRNPAAVFTALVKQNQDRTLDNASQTDKRLQGRKKVHTATGVNNNLQPSSKSSPSNSTLESHLYGKVADLLVQNQLVLSPSKARHYTQLAFQQHLPIAELERIVEKTLKVVPGQRSSYFEAAFNSALINGQVVELSPISSLQPQARRSYSFQSIPRSNNGFDLTKYTGAGKYAFLTAN